MRASGTDRLQATSLYRRGEIFLFPTPSSYLWNLGQWNLALAKIVVNQEVLEAGEIIPSISDGRLTND